MMMLFSDCFHKNKLKNKATSNIKIHQFLSSSGLDNVDIYLIDGPFSSVVRMATLHPSKGTHWVAFINKYFFDS